MTLSSAWTVLRRRGLTPLLAAVYWQGRAAVSRRTSNVRYIEKRVMGSRMLLDLEDPGISRTLLLFGTREAEQVAILERVLEPGMTVLDIGANIGYYALIERRLIGADGHLVAIEPAPSNAHLLRRNLELNGYSDVEILEVAASDRPGRAALHLSEMSNLNTLHPDGVSKGKLTGAVVEVETVSVPQLFEGRRPPDLIRMDIEGHEVEVVSGMLESIETGAMAPMILFEPHINRYAAGHDMSQVLQRLFDAGYRVPLVGSSSESGTRLIESMGYRGEPPIRTDDRRRVVFQKIDPRDLIRLVTVTGGARTVLLAPTP